MNVTAGLTRSSLGLLLIILILQSLSFWRYLPSWLLGSASLVFLYLLVLKRAAPPLFRLLFTALNLFLFVSYFGFNISVDMAAAFLFLATTLKLLELRRLNDLLVFILVMIYLSCVSFLFSQHFINAALQFLVVILCFGLLANQYGGAQSLGMRWRQLLSVSVYALPLVLVAFLFFPRLAPLWNIPIKTNSSAATGLSEQLSPGDIAELAQSSERAFRVEFFEGQPDTIDLYWRGAVLDFFDGKTWSSRLLRESPQNRRAPQLMQRPGAAYQVMLEANNKDWVFALDGSSIASTNVVRVDKGQFRLQAEAIQATQYRFAYQPDQLFMQRLEGKPGSARLLGLNDQNYESSDLQVPFSGNPEARQWIKDKIRAYPDPLKLVDYLMTYFQSNPFYYTLEPPPMPENMIDRFLFQERRGFCAHYASSLAFLLRLAEIPARVVVGYQGGEANEQGGYTLVRQYNAHAWVEAWIPGNGWLRLDPTAMVAPSRVLDSLETSLQEEGSFLSNNPVGRAVHEIGILSWATMRLDELNFQWQKWIVNYDESAQADLFGDWLGGFSLARIGWLFVALFVVFGLSMVFIMFLNFGQRPRRSRVQKKYLCWLWVVSRFGYRRHRGETPLQFLVRLQDNAPKSIYRITHKLTLELESHDYSQGCKQ